MVRGLEKGQKPALLISEMQRAMADRSLQDRDLSQNIEARGIVPRIAFLADRFRAVGAPVVHCTLVPAAGFEGFPVNCAISANLRKRGLLQKGAPGADIIEALTPAPQDIVSERRSGMTAFHATELERILRGLGVSTVVLAGVSTNIALLGIAIEAVNRMFEVVVPRDCVSSGDAGGAGDTNLRVHFPLLGAVTDADSVAEAISNRLNSENFIA